MDTQVAERPEIQIRESGEGQPLQFEPPGTDRKGAFRPLGDAPHERSASSAKSQRKRRNGLMVTASACVVLAAGAGVFWISPYNHYHFAEAARFTSHARDMAMNALPAATPLAPAAQLARAPEPTRTPIPDHPPVTIKPSAQDAGDDMALFLKLGGRSSGAASHSAAPVAQPIPAPPHAIPTAAAATTPVAVVAELKNAAPSAVAPQAGPPTARPVAALPERPAAPAAPALPAEAKPTPLPGIPEDPVAKVAMLQAAPMTDTTQLQVLQLVTQLGTLIRDQRVEIAQLRSDQQGLTQRVDGSLTDFGRRLSLAEARGAMNAALGVATTPMAMAAAPQQASSRNGVTPVVADASSPQAAPVDTGTHRYHVQAASPGMAMLSELDPAGGEERQVPVGPGAMLPGYGKVISISQQGATWVVNTDHGSIQ